MNLFISFLIIIFIWGIDKKLLSGIFYLVLNFRIIFILVEDINFEMFIIKEIVFVLSKVIRR